MMIYNFYDTCSLLMRATNLFDDVNEKIIISSVTLQELENINQQIAAAERLQNLFANISIKRFIPLAINLSKFHRMKIYFELLCIMN